MKPGRNVELDNLCKKKNLEFEKLKKKPTIFNKHHLKTWNFKQFLQVKEWNLDLTRKSIIELFIVIKTYTF